MTTVQPLDARWRPAASQGDSPLLGTVPGALVLLHGRGADEHDLFPLLDPLLFRVGGRLRTRPTVLRLLRTAKVPIPGYYALEIVVEP